MAGTTASNLLKLLIMTIAQKIRLLLRKHRVLSVETGMEVTAMFSLRQAGMIFLTMISSMTRSKQ